MFTKVPLTLLLAAGVVIVSAERRPYYGGSEEDRSGSSRGSGDSYGPYNSDEVSYSFSWSVEDESSENYYGHQESRDGDQTEGSYYVQLPDGRLMTVEYQVDGDSGFVPEITFEGSAEFESREGKDYGRGSDDSRKGNGRDSNESRGYQYYRPNYSR